MKLTVTDPLTGDKEVVFETPYNIGVVTMSITDTTMMSLEFNKDGRYNPEAGFTSKERDAEREERRSFRDFARA